MSKYKKLLKLIIIFSAISFLYTEESCANNYIYGFVNCVNVSGKRLFTNSVCPSDYMTIIKIVNK